MYKHTIFAVMNSTTLHIKNMVCNRCIKVVKDDLQDLNIPVADIELGRVEVPELLSTEQLESIRNVLSNDGFELIDDKKGQLIDRIKTLIIEYIHYHKNEDLTINVSDYIASEVGYEYTYLSSLFSLVEGITIEKYIINHRVEKVKELLVYNELSLKEIAWQLGYSSVQHLSTQFKKVTGLTPSHFKDLKDSRRKPLDKV